MHRWEWERRVVHSSTDTDARAGRCKDLAVPGDVATDIFVAIRADDVEPYNIEVTETSVTPVPRLDHLTGRDQSPVLSQM